jgi:hypothetical protein
MLPRDPWLTIQTNVSEQLTVFAQRIVKAIQESL